MEPSIFNTLKRYFQAGGSPENVIQLLSENYTAVAQTVNLLAEWLIQTANMIKVEPYCKSTEPGADDITGVHAVWNLVDTHCPGVEPVQVQETVENHLKSLLIKHFDPRKADSIFTEEGEGPSCHLADCGPWPALGLLPPELDAHGESISTDLHDRLYDRISTQVTEGPPPVLFFVCLLADPSVAGTDDRTHHMAGPFLQTG
ncbi:hypothetical protein P7K49_009990 [Saguinus oedipus]|uniref:Uncharacterized protein n=1 Tax=Saguinus oedipus TaxID=9490 RepID=A0ABQ9VMY4_SAGOE|nr:hypothetical protein P7K49_009990 [Saguinus oedipus]